MSSAIDDFRKQEEIKRLKKEACADLKNLPKWNPGVVVKTPCGTIYDE